MTTSIPESATKKKKRRIEHVDDAREETSRKGAPSTNQVTSPPVDLPDPLKLVGSRLEPIHGLLELQPPSLKTNIIRITKLMLDKLDKINVQISNCKRFNQPVKDPKTGDILKDKDNQAILFVP